VWLMPLTLNSVSRLLDWLAKAWIARRAPSLSWQPTLDDWAASFFVRSRRIWSWLSSCTPHADWKVSELLEMRIVSELYCDRAWAFSCARSAVSMSAAWLGLVLIFKTWLASIDRSVGPGKTSDQTIEKTRRCLCRVLLCTSGSTSWSGEDQ
jgi:hypothetical protein